MQHARNAAISAFTEFIAALRNGELIARGVPPNGLRCELEPAEWTPTDLDLILDVRNGDLIEAPMFYPSRVRWSNITLRAAEPVRAAEPLRTAAPERKLRRIDWTIVEARDRSSRTRFAPERKKVTYDKPRR
jgi:hypothetical protein